MKDSDSAKRNALERNSQRIIRGVYAVGTEERYSPLHHPHVEELHASNEVTLESTDGQSTGERRIRCGQNARQKIRLEGARLRKAGECDDHEHQNGAGIIDSADDFSDHVAVPRAGTSGGGTTRSTADAFDDGCRRAVGDEVDGPDIAAILFDHVFPHHLIE